MKLVLFLAKNTFKVTNLISGSFIMLRFQSKNYDLLQ